MPAGRSADERWGALVESMLGRPETMYGSAGSGPRRAFGSTSLKTNGKIFAMLANGRLVVKLDRRRVDSLVASGDGERFDPGHGRLMKEWLAVNADADVVWDALASEAEAFVAGRSREP